MRVFALVLLLAITASTQASRLRSNSKGVRQRAWTTADCTGEKGNGDRCCKMGQGDCDWDSDCCDGLKCGFDWGWATDVCVSGPTTKNFTWTDWTEWSDCSVSCGATGEQSRTRNCIGPVDGGIECPTESETETQSCDAPACWTDFGDWSECSLSCGGTGTQTRSKSCIEPENGGLPCPAENTEEENQDCDAPACWTDFGDWSECSLSCGGTGTQTRSKSCIEPENGGLPCPAENTEEENQDCDAPACWTDFGDWSECSLSCGGTGTQTRSKSCIEPENGGLPCPAENTEEENQNCDAPACWTEFSAWSPCEGMCGSPGSQTRSRSCIEPSEGGLPCPAESTESEDQECDTTGLWAVAAP